MHMDTNQMKEHVTPKISISYFWYKEDYEFKYIFILESRGISIRLKLKSRIMNIWILVESVWLRKEGVNLTIAICIKCKLSTIQGHVV